MLLIKFYQKCISPLFPAKCKYHPTCSAYAMTAFRRFGFIRGFLLSGWRILRCNPWSLGGYDPVPERFTFKVKKYNFCEEASDEEAEDENEFKRDEY